MCTLQFPRNESNFYYIVFQFWVNDLHVGSDLKGNGTHIAASDEFMAFIHDSKCNVQL